MNDMQAGSPDQRAYLKAHQSDWEAYKNGEEYKEHGDKSPDHYSWVKRALESAGLQPDPNYMHNEQPYSYGSAWLKEELPKEVVQEILSWSDPAPEKTAESSAKKANAVNAAIGSVGIKDLAAMVAASENNQEADTDLEAE